MTHRKTQKSLPPLREKVDQYSFTSKQSIGKGFSSSVYKGKDDRTDEEVAIKVINTKAMKGQIYKNLLSAEIEILKMIKNQPNLLDVQKIYSDKNKTYIITDYCEGGDLGKYIKSKRKLTEKDATKMLMEIIKGYEGLYTLGVVHRDLKPANIFFKNSHLEIGDFGFAVKQEKLLPSEKYNVGSPVYMPPEALTSNKYSHKSDIWAIGVIFYEMLTGNTPWSGRTQADLKNKIKTIPIYTILPQNISKASSQFLKKTLQVDQHKRMEPYEMFQFFKVSHENDEDEPQNMAQPQANRLFRSTRKNFQLGSKIQKKGKGISVNKERKNLGQKMPSQNNETERYSIVDPPSMPKTAQNIKKISFISPVQKRLLSKQLLSQIHLCRFLYKSISNLDGISFEFNPATKDQLILIMFYKLFETKNLHLVDEEMKEEYRQFADYAKLAKLVDDYEEKYNGKIRLTNSMPVPQKYTTQMYDYVCKELTQEVKKMYGWLKEQQNSEQPIKSKQVITLDYLVTIIQLLKLLRSGNLEQFHRKSKIQSIVDGESISNVTNEHLKMIGAKLTTLTNN